jgi:hypothetical protein
MIKWHIAGFESNFVWPKMRRQQNFINEDVNEVLIET